MSNSQNAMQRGNWRATVAGTASSGADQSSLLVVPKVHSAAIVRAPQGAAAIAVAYPYKTKQQHT